MVVYGLGRGGAERVALEASKGLLDRGCTVELIDCAQDPPLNEWDLPTGVKLRRTHPFWRRLVGSSLPEGRLRRKLLRSQLHQRTAGRHLRRHVARLAPHAVIVQASWVTASVAKALGSVKEGPPVVGVLHSGRPEALDGIAQQLAEARATARVTQPRWAVVNPSFARAAASKLGIDESEVVDLTNGCDTERVVRMAREAEPAADADTVLWAHRHMPVKRGEDAIAAFAIARRQRPMRLLMLGEGEEHTRLRALADATGFGADILMPGFAGNPYADMAACGAFLLTSDSEGLPLTLVEALSLGTFCVSTDCPHGPGHILNDPRLGRLAPVGDTGRLAEAMLAALELRRTEPPGAREFRARNAHERFGMEAAIDRYHRLVTSLRAEAALS